MAWWPFGAGWRTVIQGAVDSLIDRVARLSSDHERTKERLGKLTRNHYAASKGSFYNARSIDELREINSRDHQLINEKIAALDESISAFQGEIQHFRNQKDNVAKVLADHFESITMLREATIDSSRSNPVLTEEQADRLAGNVNETVNRFTKTEQRLDETINRLFALEREFRKSKGETLSVSTDPVESGFPLKPGIGVVLEAQPSNSTWKSYTTPMKDEPWIAKHPTVSSIDELALRISNQANSIITVACLVAGTVSNRLGVDHTPSTGKGFAVPTGDDLHNRLLRANIELSHAYTVLSELNGILDARR